MLKKLLKNAHKQIKKQKWTFERLEIEAVLERPLYVVDDIYLDGLIFHEQQRYYFGSDYYNFNQVNQKDDLNFNLKIPIKWDRKNKIYLASKGYWDSEIVFINKFRKRFDDHHAEKWIKTPKGKIRTSMGKFKNIDQPKKMILTNSIKWIVIADKNALRKLLNNITAIGKKKAQGDGMVAKWLIRPTTKKGLRVFPCSKKQTQKYQPVRPSYHDFTKSVYCKLDKF